MDLHGLLQGQLLLLSYRNPLSHIYLDRFNVMKRERGRKEGRGGERRWNRQIKGKVKEHVRKVRRA
jgi:hypothetical protein